MENKLIFAKTHKTGSTTIQNIIFRYGMENNLTVAIPKNGMHYFNELKPFTATEVRGYSEVIPKNKFNYNLFASHSVWDHSEVRKVIPSGPSVTILRDPISVFESAYSYYGNTPEVIDIIFLPRSWKNIF